MKRLFLSILIFLLPLQLLAVNTEWTQFGGPDGNFTTTETKLLQQWPEKGPPELWRKTVGQGFASPIAVDGKIYCFATIDKKDTLTCINADDGRLLWAKNGESAYLDTYPGTRASPAVDDFYIYTFGGAGDLVCRNLVDGKERWSLDTMAETSAAPPSWGCASSPVIVGDFIYLQGGEKGPVVVAIDKSKHKIVWQSDETGPASYSAIVPATFDHKMQLLAYTGKGVLALDPQTGKTLWKQPLKQNGDASANGISPLYRVGYFFLAYGYGNGSAMFKTDGKTSELLWEKEEPASRVVAPLLEDEHLYVHHENFLECLHWPDGKEVWKQDLALGGGGQYVRAGDKMIMLSRNGELLLAKVTPEACTLINKVKLFDSDTVLASPLIYRGRLYVKGPTELICFDIADK